MQYVIYYDSLGAEIYQEHNEQTRAQYLGLYGFYFNNPVKYHRQNVMDKLARILQNC